MAKRRYRVKRGQTYIDIANATGVDIGALLQANSATPTPVGGFNVNIPTAPGTIPTAPNSTGAPPPPRTVEGGGGRTQIGATTPGFTTSGYYASPLTPTVAPPTWNPTGNAESAGRVNQQYIPPPSPRVGDGNLGPPLVPLGDPAITYTMNYIADTSVTFSVTPIMYDTLVAAGMTPEKMQEYGFTQMPDGTWTRQGSTTTPEARNPGGWYQTGDGQWKRNQNQSQIRRKEERRAANRPGSSVSSAINWSI